GRTAAQVERAGGRGRGLDPVEQRGGPRLAEGRVERQQGGGGVEVRAEVVIGGGHPAIVRVDGEPGPCLFRGHGSAGSRRSIPVPRSGSLPRTWISTLRAVARYSRSSASPLSSSTPYARTPLRTDEKAAATASWSSA